MQRVPKKPSKVKADLQNSTASQDDQVGGLSLDKIKSFVSFEEFTRRSLAEIFDFVAGLVHSSKEAKQSEG